MQYNKEICKVTDNQLVYPIKDYENIGDSLSSINYNFRVLDIYTCNFEFSAANVWNDIYTIFQNNSSNWVNITNVVKNNSGCWTNTYNTVKSLSSVWLKPISLIYPFPFDITGDEASIINDVSEWINDTLPVYTGNCYNFVEGQELYLFTPMYSEINKVYSEIQSVGQRTVGINYYCACIGSGAYIGTNYGTVDCGNARFDVSIPDKVIKEFSGMKFVVDSTISRWVYESSLYN
jgi:hypothetical protein